MISNKSIGNPISSTDSDIVKKLYLRIFNELPASSLDGYTPETRKILTNTPVQKSELDTNSFGMTILDRQKTVQLINIDLVDTKYDLKSINNVLNREFDDYASKFKTPVLLQDTIQDTSREINKLKIENKNLNNTINSYNDQINKLNTNYKNSVDSLTDTILKLKG